jgi:hypothetical protein
MPTHQVAAVVLDELASRWWLVSSSACLVARRCLVASQQRRCLLPAVVLGRTHLKRRTHVHARTDTHTHRVELSMAEGVAGDSLALGLQNLGFRVRVRVIVTARRKCIET